MASTSVDAKVGSLQPTVNPPGIDVAYGDAAANPRTILELHPQETGSDRLKRREKIDEAILSPNT